MKKRTTKNYSKLFEVQQKKEDLKKEKELQARLRKKKEYAK